MPQPTSFVQPNQDSDIVPSSNLPLYVEILEWVSAKLGPAGLPKPLCKRLAVVISGLVASDKATIGEVTTAIEGLAISPAKGESIARRLQRTFQDLRLDPSLLPVIFRPLLPELLHSQLLAHAANEGSSPSHHARFSGVIIIFDESSQGDKVHMAVAGVPFGGIVLPLAVRTWPQNVAMAEGEYWTQIMGLFQDVQEMLPPQLRDHVLLIGDRAYGVPRMLDILAALGWNWLLRVQGQVKVRLSDGQCCALRALVPKPGTDWTSGFSRRASIETEQAEPVEVFKGAGWRRSQVVAVWTKGEAEPWLLITSLTATIARITEYAGRWAIERLFLAWKSHGWDIEASGLGDAQRLGRLLTAIALATLWRLAVGVAVALKHLRDLATPSGQVVQQLRLPGFSAPPRPWPAKYSLLTWGAKAARITILRTSTPARCWRWPCWEGRTWKDTCRDVYIATRGQFSICP